VALPRAPLPFRSFYAFPPPLRFPAVILRKNIRFGEIFTTELVYRVKNQAMNNRPDWLSLPACHIRAGTVFGP
jgi:hypothetical protein